MPFLFEFYLNKEKLSGVEVGFSHSRKWEEALDEAKLSIPFYTSEEPLSQYGLMEITIQEVDNYTDLTVLDLETIEMLVVSDIVTISSQYGVYRHDITMIEYTAKLDAYIMASLAKTRDIEIDVLAKFETAEEGQQLIYNDNFDRYYNLVWLPPFRVKQKYYTDKIYTFSQVEQAYQVIDSIGVTDTDGIAYTYDRSPVVFRYHNIDTNTTSSWFTISGSDAQIEFDSIGNYYIEYGIDLKEIYNDFTSTTITAGKYPIFRFYFTVSELFQQTVYDVVNSVRNNVSKGGGIESDYYFNDTRIFDIDSSIVDELKSIQIPQMYLEQATARQMLIFALSYINALPRLEYGEDLDTLKIEKFNLSTGSFTKQDIYEQSGSQNINQIGTRSYAPLNQVLPNNMDEATTYSPSQDSYQQVRATNLQITGSSFCVKLQKELYTPKEFVVNVPKITISNDSRTINEYFYSGTLSKVIENIDVSLIERLINIEEWRLKDLTDNFPSITTFKIWDEQLGLRKNMVENLYWQLGAKTINLSDVYGQLINSTLFQNVIKLAIYEHLMINQPEPFIVTYRPGTAEELDVMVVGATDIDIDLDFMTDVTAYKELRFRFAYLTIENLITKQDKEDLSQIDFYSEMRQNQDETIINMVRSSRKKYGDLQRTGNKAFSFTKVHYSLSNQYEVGQVDTNNFTITQINRQFYGKFFLAEYFVTKYYNRESRQTIVDQTYRWRDNYTKNVFDRHENYSDYLMVYPPSTTVGFRHTKIYSKENTVYTMLKVLLGETISDFSTRATVALIRTDGMLEYLPEESFRNEYNILSNVSAFPTTKGVAFTFGFDNNQVAGDGLVQRGSNWYNQAVRYTNENGRFSKLSFIIKSKFELEEDDYEIFPRVTKQFKAEVFDDAYFWCGDYRTNEVGADSLVIDKDPLTNLKITYQVNVVSYNTGLYIFGQAFFNKNFLVNNPDGQMKSYLYLYNNNTKYGIFEDLSIKSGYFSTIELNETNIMYSIEDDLVAFAETKSLVGVTSWAIGSEFDELYVACNSNYNGFKIVASHFRPDVKEIGYKVIEPTPILPTTFTLYGELAFELESLSSTHTRGFALEEDLIFALENLEATHIEPLLLYLNEQLSIELDDFQANHMKPHLAYLFKELSIELDDFQANHMKPHLAYLSKELDFNLDDFQAKHTIPKLAFLSKDLNIELDDFQATHRATKLVSLTDEINFVLENFQATHTIPELLYLQKELGFNLVDFQATKKSFELIYVSGEVEFALTDFQATNKSYTAILVSEELDFRLNSLLASIYLKSWEYVSAQATEPLTGIDGGTDTNISSTNEPEESVYNYKFGDIVYYYDGALGYYIYMVKKTSK